jgi:hypothetical protein
MKRIALVLLLASLSLPAFAAKNSKSLTFASDVKVGSTKIPAGDYKISWTGSDANAQLAITKDGKSIATVPAKLQPANNGSVSLGTRTIDGVKILESIQLDKLNIVLKSATATGE